MKARFGGALMLAAAGCSINEVNLDGKACPCAPGYICDLTRHVCVLSGMLEGDGGLPPFDSGDATMQSVDGAGGPVDGRVDGADGPLGDAYSCNEAGLGNDPHNCGACGHDCLGGGCNAGRCQPVAIAAEAGCPSELSADPPFLYWVDSCAGPTIVQCSHPPGCSTIQTIAFPSGTVAALGATGGAQGGVYWADDGSSGEISSCVATGCPETGPTVLETGLVGVNGLSAQGAVVYWTLGSPTGGVGYFDVALGTTGSISNRPLASAIVAQVPWVAWAEQAGVYVCPYDQPCPNPAPAMTTSGAAFDVAIGGTVAQLVWGDTTGVHACPLPCNPSAARTLASASAPRSVLADDAYAYWVESPSPILGTLYRCPLSGCSAAGPEVVATAASTVITMDSAALYWSVSTGIVMLAK